MGIHRFPENMTHMPTPISGTGSEWYTSTTEYRHLHDHFLKTFCSECPTTDIQGNSQSCKQWPEWNCGEVL